MSVQVMSWVFAHAPKDLRPAETLVAIILANHASSDGGHAYPSVQTIMDETRLTRRSVQTALRSLEERGVIEVEREATRRLPAMYGFVSFRGAEFAPHNEEGVQTMQSGAQSTHVRGAEFAPKPSVEPSENRQVPPCSPPAGGSAPKDTRATRLKDDWEPKTEMVDWACVNVPCSMFDCKRETEKFMDHFIGNGKRMVDWDRAWKNWMRRSREFAPRGSANGATKPEDRRPAIPSIEQVLQPAKALSPEKLAEVRAWREKRA